MAICAFVAAAIFPAAGAIASEIVTPQEWVLHSPSSQGLYSVAVSPNYAADRTVFAGGRDAANGGSGALYKSVDGGETWTTLYEAKYGDIADIEYSPGFATDKTLFVLHATNGYQLLKSIDGGNSWAMAAYTWAWDSAISPDYPVDQTIFHAGDQTGFKSMDGGNSWQSAHLPAPSDVLAISPAYAADRTIFAGGRNGLFKSTDGGATWAPANNGLPYNVNVGTSIDSLAISPKYAEDNTLFATVWAEGTYRSRDGGTSWHKVNPLPTWTTRNAMAVSPAFSTDRTLFVASEATVLMSTDGGDSWTEMPNMPITPGTDIVYALAVSPEYSADGTIFAATSKGLYTFSFKRDVTVRATINSGATYTSSPSVTLSLTCDDAEKCKSMSFSNDRESWTASEAFSPAKSWIISSGDGAKTVYIRFTDEAGTWSKECSAGIILDTTHPETYLDSIVPRGENREFTFSSDDTSATFECRLDAGTFAPCPSWLVTGNLSAGSHTFEVRAVDPAGNIDRSPALYEWTSWTATIITEPSKTAITYKGHKGTLSFRTTGSVSAETVAGAIAAPSWITVNPAKLKLSKGIWTIPYEVAANTGIVERTGTISIRNATFTLTQEPASCSLRSVTLSRRIPSQGGALALMVDVHPNECGWKIDSLKVSPSGSQLFFDQGNFPNIETTATGDYLVVGNVAANIAGRARKITVEISTIDGKSRKTVVSHQSR